MDPEDAVLVERSDWQDRTSLGPSKQYVIFLHAVKVA